MPYVGARNEIRNRNIEPRCSTKSINDLLSGELALQDEIAELPTLIKTFAASAT